MLVTVTGGTGFVGAHAVPAIVRAGHRVRLLVRDESKVDRVLGPLEVDPSAVDVVAGDVLDENSVSESVRGADAVLHAASVYSFDSRQHALMRQTNERGTEVVLGAARRAGCDPIVHVSSVVALFPAAERVIREDSPVGRPREKYMASKAAAEVVARQHQDDGAPVVIVYPPALLGPHDPNLGDTNARLRDVLRGLTPIWPLGGFPLGDVRDTAAVLAAVVKGSRSERNRCFGAGHYLSTREYVRTLRSVTGRWLPTVFLPARGMYPVGWLADRLQRVWPWHIPAEFGAIYTCACATRVDDAASTLDVAPRSIVDTVADTVAWLHRSGHLSARQAGSVGGGDPVPAAAR